MNNPQEELAQEYQENLNAPHNQERLREIAEWIFQMAIVSLIVIAVNTFLCRLVFVSGESMYPTLHDQDVLLIRMAGYTPESGDIVVCRTEEDGLLGGKHIVKRCIATAGQTVFVDYAANVVMVDGVALEETYINLDVEDPMDPAGRENAFYLVPEGHIFVLGDNRNYSADSRGTSVGMVNVEKVIGCKVFRIPLGQWLEQT